MSTNLDALLEMVECGVSPGTAAFDLGIGGHTWVGLLEKHPNIADAVASAEARSVSRAYGVLMDAARAS